MDAGKGPLALHHEGPLRNSVATVHTQELKREGELRSRVKQGHVALIGLDINYLW